MVGAEDSRARVVLSPDEGEMVTMVGLGAIMAKYRLDMDFASIPRLAERHGLATGEPGA